MFNLVFIVSFYPRTFLYFFTCLSCLGCFFGKLRAVNKLRQLKLPQTKSSGLNVVTTCSPHNAPLLRQLGADAVFDYRDPDCGRKIREHTSNSLLHVFDCVSEGSSPQICADALSSSSASSKLRYSALLGITNFPRDDVDVKVTVAYTAIGEESITIFAEPVEGKLPTIPANEEDARFMIMFVEIAEGILSEGKIKAHPVSVRDGGLAGVFEGLQEMREGRVSGEKLVYRIADTT